MRSRKRDRQKIWFSNVTEKKVGIDTVQEYSKPIMRKLTVSAGTGAPVGISAGMGSRIILKKKGERAMKNKEYWISWAKAAGVSAVKTVAQPEERICSTVGSAYRSTRHVQVR